MPATDAAALTARARAQVIPLPGREQCGTAGSPMYRPGDAGNVAVKERVDGLALIEPSVSEIRARGARR
jgi:hypothetical protein